MFPFFSEENHLIFKAIAIVLSITVIALSLSSYFSGEPNETEMSDSLSTLLANTDEKLNSLEKRKCESTQNHRVWECSFRVNAEVPIFGILEIDGSALFLYDKQMERWVASQMIGDPSSVKRIDR